MFSDVLVYGKPVSTSLGLTQQSASTLRLTRGNSVSSNGSAGSGSHSGDSGSTSATGAAGGSGEVVAPNVLYSLSLPELALLDCRVTKKSEGCAFKILNPVGELLLLAL